MKFTRTSAALTASMLLSTAAAVPVKEKSSSTAPPYLNDLARGAGKHWFGTAADIPGTAEVTDAGYQAILRDTHIFGEITPANYMKFMYVEPEQNVFNFTGGDYVLDFAERYGKQVRCHNLIWVSELPDWVLNGNWTAETLTAVMKNHIQKTITYFGDRCYSWDVVNEALNGDGTFSSNIFYDTIGEEYFYLAYQFATEAVREAHLHVKLYYNDYGIENPGTKTTAALGLVHEIKKRNFLIDGVGLEAHFEVGATPSSEQITEAIQSFNAAGVEVALTELDIRFVEAPYYNATGEAVQAYDYYQAVSGCVGAGPGCIGVVVWDFDDAYSWVPGTFAGQGGADIYNATLERKPAYYAIAEAFQRKKCTVCS